MLPNFLILGEGRCGTTAMWHFLRRHPDVYMSDMKEPMFFALHGRPVDFRGPGYDQQPRVTEYGEYEQLFNKVNGESAIGEASTWYLSSPNAAPAIKMFIPDAKLVIIVRDPVERAFSHYSVRVKEGQEPLSSFREAMYAEGERIRDLWSPRFHYKKRGFYFKHISHYRRFFSPNQIKVYLYEDFVNNSDAFFSDIFNYLGVDPMRVDARERFYDSRLPKSKAFDRMVWYDHPVKGALKPFLPQNWRRRLKQAADNLNRKKPVLSGTDREEFVKVFREDVLRLSDLLKRDLSKWLGVER